MKIQLILGVTLCFIMWSCGSSKGELLEQVGQLQRQVHALERKASGDEEADALVKTCRQKLQEAEDLLVEGDTEKARALLAEVGDLLSAPPEPEKKRARGPLAINGTVTWLRSGQDTWEKMTEGAPLRKVAGVRTGIRSDISINLNSLKLQAPDQAEIHFSDGVSAANLQMELVKGVVRVDKRGGAPAVLNLGTLNFSLSSGMVNAANYLLTDTMWISLLSGSAEWEAGGTQETLTGGEGLVWESDAWKKVVLPVAPQLVVPRDRQKMVTSSKLTSVAFRWLGAPGVIYQIQVSRTEDFEKPDFDRIDVKGDQTTAMLGEGRWFWRVRGFVEGAPGPFSRVMSFSLAEGEEDDEGKNAPASTAKGPPINNVRLEVFGDTVIVTGRTKQGSHISVNGEKAMVEDDGSFRTIIRFKQRGVHKVLIKSADPDSGAETLTERDVKISIR